ncbi:hypothetical protein ACFU8W_44265 [Streptomyces sp. NPDC057565]|uniref:hypothetical protein n=1 Tax=Streptomyces sp. NPDC057565 TaxID=3346169 RepID=UPI0036AD1738
MGSTPSSLSSAGASAVRALVHALACVALAVGVHHATADSRLSMPAVLAAAVAVALPAAWALRPRGGAGARAVLAAACGALPVWLEATGTSVPADHLDDHLRLPPVWHHNMLLMAALNMLAAHALIALLRGAGRVPARLGSALSALMRPGWRHLLGLVALLLCSARPFTAPAPTGRRHRHEALLPVPHRLTARLHLGQPCAP